MRSANHHRLFIFLCALLAVVTLSAKQAHAVIKLAKLPNWSAVSLVRPHGLIIRPADSNHKTLVGSWTGYKVIVSEAGDSTPVFSHVFDNEVDSVHAIAVGNFSSDSSIDVAILNFDFRKFSRPIDTGFLLQDSVELHLLVQGITGSFPVDTVSYVIPRGKSIASWKFFPQPVLLTSGYFTGANKENLVISLGWLKTMSYSPWIREASKGFTKIWNTFPDDLDTTLPYPSSFLQRESSQLSFIRVFAYDYDEIFSPDEESEFNLIHAFKELNSLHRLPDNFGRCQGQYLATSISKQLFNVAGDELMDSSSAGVLITQYGLKDCQNDSYAEMFALDDTLGATSIWKRDSFPYNNYVFHPNRPGRFMAQSGNTIYEFNSATGEIIDSTSDPLPTGIQGWYDLFGDGQQYLVTLNDTLLEAYGFDFVTDVGESGSEALLPGTFALSAPYPNPFNPSVSFALTVTKKTDVTVAVYNVLGQKVTTLYSGLVHSGETTFRWDATDYSSGLYFIRATTTNSLADTRKAVLLK